MEKKKKKIGRNGYHVHVQNNHIFILMKGKKTMVSFEIIPSAKQLTEKQSQQFHHLLFSTIEEEEKGRESKKKEKKDKELQYEKENGLTSKELENMYKTQGILFSNHISSPIIGLEIFEKITRRGESHFDQTLVLLRENSTFEVWQYNDHNFFWKKSYELRLVAREITIGEVVFISEDDQLAIFCLEPYFNKSGHRVCDVFVHYLEINDNGNQLEGKILESEKILTESLNMNMFPIKGGVGFIPKQQFQFQQSQDELPIDLCFFWCTKLKQLTSLIWGAPFEEMSLNVAPNKNLELSSPKSGKKYELPIDLWKNENPKQDSSTSKSSTPLQSKQLYKKGKEDLKQDDSLKQHQIISFFVHPISKELLVLEKSGDIIVCTLKNGNMTLKHFCKLQSDESENFDCKIIGFTLQKSFLYVFTSNCCRFVFLSFFFFLCFK